MKRLIIFATGNAGKVREVKEILRDPDTTILTMREAGVAADPEEDGSTFEENALIKVRAVRPLALAALQEGRIPGADADTELFVLSDDSGLVIDALDGAPGIYSARYMGYDTDYRLKMNHLLDLMRGVPEEKRTARFVAAVGAIFPDGSEHTVRGTMEGRIDHEIRGENGFGYDPFFYLPEYGMTSAQITEQQKNAISHRGKALRAMIAQIDAWEQR